MRWKSSGILRQSVDNFSANANVKSLFYFLMAVPTFQHSDFKKAIYSTTLKSALAILLYNLTVVRVLPAALLQQSKKSTAPYQAALGFLWCPGV